MGFDDITAADAAIFISEFANCTVTGQLAGVGVRTFRAIFDDSASVASPYEMDQTEFKPQMTALSADISAIAGAQTFDITRDGETEGKRYCFDGKPRPDGAGLTVVFLAVNK